MTRSDDTKTLIRDAYDGIAADYDARLAQYSARFAADLIDLMHPQKGEAALDIAGGTGAAGLKLAERIGPDGSVTIVDLAPAMLEIAARSAIRKQLQNVQTRVMDAERLEFADSSFDLVTCCQAAMAFPDIGKALAEAKRVLKPGGRIGFTVWSVPNRFPFLAEPARAMIRRMAPMPVRLLLRLPGLGPQLLNRIMLSKGPAGYSPARFSARGSLEKHLLACGFQNVRRELRAFPFEFDSFDDFWKTLTRGTPMKSSTNLPPAVLAEVRRDLEAKLINPKNGRILMFNEAGLILGSKPR